MNNVRRGTRVHWTAGEREWSPCGMDERQLYCMAQSGSCCVDNPVRSDCRGHLNADRVENPGHATARRREWSREKESCNADELRSPKACKRWRNLCCRCRRRNYKNHREEKMRLRKDRCGSESEQEADHSSQSAVASFASCTTIRPGLGSAGPARSTGAPALRL
jgi:hypothetical protein